MHTLLLAALLLAPPGAWPQWAGPNRNFEAAGSSLHEDADGGRIRELWRGPVGGGNSGVCIDGDVVVTFYSESGKECVETRSLKDGSSRWKNSYDVPYSKAIDAEFGPGPHATPLVSGGTLFCVGATGRLNAIELRTGKDLWEVQLWGAEASTRLERGYASSPVMYQDGLILQVGGTGQSVQCYSAHDGKVRWKKHNYVNSYSSPILVNLHGRQHLVALMGQELVGLDPATGDSLWSQSVPCSNYAHCASPVATNSNIIVVNTKDGLRAFKVSLGAGGDPVVEQVWANPAKICQTANFCAVGGDILGSTEAGVFMSLDASTGKVNWKSRALGRCSFVHNQRAIMAVEETGQVTFAVIRGEEPEVVWRTKPLTGRCWVVPAVSGRLLAVRDSRQVVAYELDR